MCIVLYSKLECWPPCFIVSFQPTGGVVRLFMYGPVYDKHTTLLCNQVCCVEEEHLCFAWKEGKWIIYGSKTIEARVLDNLLLFLFYLVMLMIFVCICSLQILGRVCSIGIAIEVSDPKYFSLTVLDIAVFVDHCC